MLADDPDEDVNIYSEISHRVLMRKMDGLPYVRFNAFLEMTLLHTSLISLSICCPECEPAHENEAAALLPQHRDEDEWKEGVMTRVTHNTGKMDG